MIRHILGGFERAAVVQKHCDTCAAKGVVAEFLRQPRRAAAGLDHIEHVAPRNGLAGEPVRLIERLEEGRVRIVNTGYGDIGIQKFLRLAMQPDQLLLVAFFQQSQARPLAFQAVVCARQSQPAAAMIAGTGNSDA